MRLSSLLSHACLALGLAATGPAEANWHALVADRPEADAGRTSGGEGSLAGGPGGLWTARGGTAPPGSPAPPMPVAVDIILIDTFTTETRTTGPTPVLLPAIAPAVARSGDAAASVVFTALPRSEVVAQPLRPGLPQPSIVVGIIEGVTGDAPPEPDTAPAFDISYDNTAAWQALRDEDAALFASLVDAGAIDPPDDIVAQAIQAELAAMNCYRIRVDNDWGPGSQNAAQAYFDELAEAGPGFQQASVALFRFVVTNNGVACATPVAAPAPARQATPQPAPQPQPAPRSSGGGATFGGGVGVFR